MEEGFKEPNFTNNVVCIKMATGETLIGLTNDDADGIEGLYLISPKLLDIQYYDDGDTYEILDWMLGSIDIMHFIDELHIIAWYKVDEDMTKEYLTLLRGELYGEDAAEQHDQIESINEYLKTVNPVH